MSSAPGLDSYVPEMNSQGCADFLNHAALMLITIQKAVAVTIVLLFQEKIKKIKKNPSAIWLLYWPNSMHANTALYGSLYSVW